jgi:23S rRNA pseudouridine1911/1915/1917 synthase
MEKIISETDGIRLDNFLKEKYPEYSRGYFQRLIKGGHATINGRHAESDHRLKTGDEVDVNFIAKEQKLTPTEMQLTVVYEDDDIIVVNKRPNLVVHPAGIHQTDTLVNGLLDYWHCEIFPFLVHRLDKDTSGIIVVAKNEKAKEALSSQFQKRTVEKKYLAIVDGVIREDEAVIEAPLGRSPDDKKKIIVGPASRKSAKTFVRVLKRFKNATYIEAKPYTGRTHQIRAHLVFMGHPVLGDADYGRKTELAGRQMLHAAWIKVRHPGTKQHVEFSAGLPADFKKALEGLENEKDGI